jgi:hypothetical protein
MRSVVALRMYALLAALALYSLVAVSSLREPYDQVRAITTLGYRN